MEDMYTGERRVLDRGMRLREDKDIENVLCFAGKNLGKIRSALSRNERFLLRRKS